MIREKKDKGNDEFLYVAGYIKAGKNKGKFVAVQVRNTMMINPVEPIFEQYPEIEVLIVGKKEKSVKKFFQKLL